MKLGLDDNSIRFQNWPILKMIDNIYALGFDKISINLNILRKCSRDVLLAVRQKLTDLGIEVFTSGSALFPYSFMSGLNCQEKMSTHVSNFVEDISISQVLGSKYLRTFVLENSSWPNGYQGFNRHKILCEASRILTRVQQHAVNLEVKLVIENHQDYSANELLELIKETDKSGVGICFDFGNQIAIGEHPVLALEVLSSRIEMCHIKDIAIKKTKNGYSWRSVPLGKGCLPLKELYHRAKQLQIEHIFLEISTSRTPQFVDYNNRKLFTLQRCQDISDFILTEARWLPEVDLYLCREVDIMEDVAAQEIKHLKESISWFKNELIGVNS